MFKNQSVSIIIPIFNGRKLLEKHLPTVLRASRDGDEIIFVDDASRDESSRWLQYGFKLKQQKKPNLKDTYGIYELFQGFYSSGRKKISITLISNETNCRFAASVNRAVGYAQKPLLYIVNTDVSLESNTLNTIVHSYQTNAQPIFAIGCLEYEGSTKSAKKAGKNQLWFEKGYFVHAKADDFLFGDTAWASGGSSLFDANRWRELGGFDVRFAPAYWEDIDLSYRARLRGWQVLFEPKAVVFHQHETTNQTEFKKTELAKLSWRNANYFVSKHGNVWQKLAHLIWQPYWFVKRLKS